MRAHALKQLALLAGAMALAWEGSAARAGDADEFRVKREAVYEFESKPAVTRSKDASSDPPRDRYTIRFASKGLCDVTVAVEDANGRILRHLASGVLGPNAPAPLTRDSRSQTLLWDGKDDQGHYVDDRQGLSIRVSLGLEARFERTLFWEPKKRESVEAQLFCPTPEGVYVYDGGEGWDFVYLYDHEGNYLRMVYPFPADKVAQVKGLAWHTFAGDGAKLPIKTNFLQNSFLTCGTNAWLFQTFKSDTDCYRSVIGAGGNAHYGQHSRGLTAMAARAGRIALADVLVNRLGTDGSSSGMEFQGPKVSFSIVSRGNLERGSVFEAEPHAAALSPDGKTLYLTGYVYPHLGHASADIVTNDFFDAIHGVFKVDMDGPAGGKMQLFAGTERPADDGTDNAHFRVPAAVAVDSQGRVYVADYMNDRVQAFDAAGKHLRTIKARRPARIVLDEKNDRLYVFSFLVHNPFMAKSEESVPATLTRMGPLSGEVKEIDRFSLPTVAYVSKMGHFYRGQSFQLNATVDLNGDEPVVWLSEAFQREDVLSVKHMVSQNIRLYAIREGKLALVRDFEADARKSIRRPRRPRSGRQRLYLNPANGKVYVGEGDSFTHKAFKQFVELDPASGKVRLVDLPFDAEDACFDGAGLLYLRSVGVVARYQMPDGAGGDFREVPWDYGEERAKVYTSSSSDRREAKVISGLALPANGGWHHGGMYVSPDGSLAVTCLFVTSLVKRTDIQTVVDGGLPFTPRIFPGRIVDGRGGGVFIHVWDKHGQLLHEDVVPGLADNTYGIGLDRDDNLYALAAATRIVDGKLYYNDMSGTLMKFPCAPRTPNRVVSASDKAPVRLGDDSVPKRPADIQNATQGKAWVNGAEWMYGGVGWGGKNLGIGCACWNDRFTLDYFARSFAPEMDRYSVAVLDSAGNLIMRIGRYGNVDDGKPLDPAGGPPATRPIGGDEVALVHGAYLATDTDRRLFIADPSNERILSVRLAYRTSESVGLENAGQP
ncbi:MAG: hypothetical protein BIFFINMI_02595 [Phycisphaerae bacterium]|nr:hypothetical protein [Phycisphaerae bacterium]